MFWGQIFGEISARTCEINFWSSIDSFLSGAPLVLISLNFPLFSRVLCVSDFLQGGADLFRCFFLHSDSHDDVMLCLKFYSLDMSG